MRESSTQRISRAEMMEALRQYAELRNNEDELTEDERQRLESLHRQHDRLCEKYLPHERNGR